MEGCHGSSSVPPSVQFASTVRGPVTAMDCSSTVDVLGSNRIPSALTYLYKQKTMNPRESKPRSRALRSNSRVGWFPTTGETCVCVCVCRDVPS
jgi:hypothetical protein